MKRPPRTRPGSSKSGEKFGEFLAEPSAGQILIIIIAVFLILALAMAAALG